MCIGRRKFNGMWSDALSMRQPRRNRARKPPAGTNSVPKPAIAARTQRVLRLQDGVLHPD